MTVQITVISHSSAQGAHLQAFRLVTCCAGFLCRESSRMQSPLKSVQTDSKRQREREREEREREREREKRESREREREREREKRERREILRGGSFRLDLSHTLYFPLLF